MAKAAVANPTSVDEEVLHPGVAAIACRVGNETRQRGVPRPRLQGIKPIGNIRTEEQIDAVAKVCRASDLMDQLTVMPQHEVQSRNVGMAGVAQRQPGAGLTDVAHLRARSAQELAADGGIEEELPDLDARAGRSVPGPNGRERTAMTFNDRAAIAVVRSGLNHDMGHAADGG